MTATVECPWARKLCGTDTLTNVDNRSEFYDLSTPVLSAKPTYKSTCHYQVPAIAVQNR
jgi:hypothetical protein